MKIIYSPMRRDDRLTLTKTGDALDFNGEVFDFSSLPVGATLPYSAITSTWIWGDVSRDDTGELIVPVIVPHGYNAPQSTRFPGTADDVPDGVVFLPAYEEAAE